MQCSGIIELLNFCIVVNVISSNRRRSITVSLTVCSFTAFVSTVKQGHPYVLATLLPKTVITRPSLGAELSVAPRPF